LSLKYAILVNANTTHQSERPKLCMNCRQSLSTAYLCPLIIPVKFNFTKHIEKTNIMDSRQRSHSETVKNGTLQTTSWIHASDLTLR